MDPLPRPEARFSAGQVLHLSLALASLVAILAAGVYMSLDSRRQTTLRAQDTAEMLVRILERDIARNIEVLDLSLQAVVEGATRGDVAELDPDLQRLVLFDRSASASGLGALILFDKEGRNILDSLHREPLAIKPVVDRDYFQAQAKGDLGLFISRPYVSRLIGRPVVGLSRRVSGPDGSFKGVALATIEMSYLSGQIARMQMASGTVVTLVRADGVVLLRQGSGRTDMDLDFSGLPDFQRMTGAGSGTATRTSQYDGVERLYAFQRIGDYPLILVIGFSTGTVYADWRGKTALLGFILMITTVVIFTLMIRIVRELGRRRRTEASLKEANAHLERLSTTDGLTGLGNRRYFDRVLAHETRRAARTEAPLSLLLLDVDHFKAFNDRYGHSAGDAALRFIASTLRDCARRGGDVLFRIGGEEFAVVLPETSADAASILANSILDALRTAQKPHAGSPKGYVSASIGGALVMGADSAGAFGLADAALYEAKRSGRDRFSMNVRLAA